MIKISIDMLFKDLINDKKYSFPQCVYVCVKYSMVQQSFLWISTMKRLKSTAWMIILLGHWFSGSAAMAG